MSVSYLERLESRLLLSAVSPALWLDGPVRTADLTPHVSVLATDGSGFDTDALIHFDIDLNNDGDYDDPGELDFASATSQATITLVQQSKFLPSDGIADNDQFEFGSAVAISGSTAVVGRAKASTSSTQHGSVYVFEFDGQGWNESSRIPAPLTGGFDSQFGETVALHGDLLVVGSRLADTAGVHAGGVAFVYERQEGEFVFVKQLESSDQLGGEFGKFIDTDGQTIVIGAPAAKDGLESPRGRAYVFEKIAGEWTESKAFSPPMYQRARTFAASVSIDGDTLAIGETGEDQFGQVYAGGVHLYERANGEWVYQSTLRVDDISTGTGNNFGHRISLDGDTLAVRSGLKDNLRTTLFVFKRENGEWNEVRQFPQGKAFNDSVALSGDIIVTRGVLSPNGRTPIAIYQRIDGHWHEAGSYFATDDGGDHFGQALAIDGNTILASAPESGGAVYTFTVEPQQKIQNIVATIDLPQLLVGDYQLRARVQDASGLETITESRSLAILQPSAPRVDVTLPEFVGDIEPVRFTEDSTPDVSVVAHDSNGLVVGDNVFIDVDLNDDGDFDDLGESAFAQGSLIGLQTYEQSGAFQPGEIFDTDEFGLAVSIDGNRAVVGSPYDDEAGEDVGAVYLFDFDGSNWVQSGKLTLADPVRQEFGGKVALDGDRLLVSAEEPNSGPHDGDAVYVFDFDGSTWNQTAVITSPAGRGSEFGYAIALNGDRAVISAPDILVDGGVVYVFEFSGGQWGFVEELEPSDGPSGSEFGWSVDLDGDRIIVGDRRTSSANDEKGRAYIYEFDGSVWLETAVLQSAMLEESDDFGFAVAIEDGVALVGAPFGDGRIGLAFVYEKVGSQWEFAEQLKSNPNSFNQFGYSVAIDSGVLLVGARRGDTNIADDGTAFVFQKVGQHWVEIAEIVGDEVGPGENFGTAVGISDGQIVVTSNPRLPSDQGSTSGAADFFSASTISATNGAAAAAIDLPVLADGRYSIRARVGDADGNMATTPSEGLTVQATNLAPSLLNISPTDASLITDSRLELQLEFSEPVIGFTKSDIVIGGSAAVSASVSDPQFEGGHRWSISIGELIDGDLTISIAPNLGDVIDVAGLSIPTSLLEYDVIVDPPNTESLSHDVEKVIDRSYFDLYVNYDQRIITNGNLDFQLTGEASLNAIVDTRSGDNFQRGIEFTGLSNGALQLMLAPVPGGIFNTAGKDLLPVTLDMVVELGPTILNRTPDSGVITSNSMFIDVVFSEVVEGVDATDLRLYGDAAATALIGTPIDLGQDTWRFSISGLVDGILIVGLGMDRGDIIDIDGHSMQPGSWSYTIDATRPTVTDPTVPIGTTITSDVQSFGFLFSEKVLGIDDSDIIVSGSAFQLGLTNRTSAGNQFGSWVVRNLNSGDLHITVAPDPEDIVDVNGLSTVPSTWSYTVDLGDQPFVVTTQGSSRGSRTNIDILFSEPVFGVDATDLVPTDDGSTNALVGTPFQLSENVWRFPVTNLSFGDVNFRLAEDVGDIVDADGNSVPFDNWTYRFRDEPVAFDVYGNDRLIFDDSLDASFVYGTDFGTTQMGQGGPIHSFQVVNNGTEDLVLGSLTAPNGFVVVDDLDVTLAPGDETMFSVQLNSIAASVGDPSTIGLFKGDVRFSSNHPSFSPFDMEVSGYISVPPLVSQDVRVNADSDQRSVVRSISIGFSSDVSSSISVDSLTVENLTASLMIDVTDMQMVYDVATNTAVWTFPGLDGGSLTDGNYVGTLDSAGIVDDEGNSLGANVTLEFHRLFGDKDGDRVVGLSDLFSFRSTFQRPISDPLNDLDFDGDGDGAVGISDLFRFRSNYQRALEEPSMLLPIQPVVSPGGLFGAFPSSVSSDDPDDDSPNLFRVEENVFRELWEAEF